MKMPFYFKGTLLVDFDVETMTKSLRVPIVKLKDKELNIVKERVTCLKWELNRDISYEEVKNALKKLQDSLEKFKKILNCEFSFRPISL